MRGRSLKYACDALSISYNTGKTHVKHIYEKLKSPIAKSC